MLDWSWWMRVRWVRRGRRQRGVNFFRKSWKMLLMRVWLFYPKNLLTVFFSRYILWSISILYSLTHLKHPGSILPFTVAFSVSISANYNLTATFSKNTLPVPIISYSYAKSSLPFPLTPFAFTYYSRRRKTVGFTDFRRFMVARIICWSSFLGFRWKWDTRWMVKSVSCYLGSFSLVRFMRRKRFSQCDKCLWI